MLEVLKDGRREGGSEVIPKFIGALVTVFWLFGEGAKDRTIHLFRDREFGPPFEDRGRSLVDVSIHHGEGMGFGRIKEARVRKHLIQDDRHRVDIGTCVDLAAHALLRGHVGGSPESALGDLRLGFEGKGFCDPEVEDFQKERIVTSLDQEKVGGFDIAVDDALLMSRAHRFAQLLEDVESERQRKGACVLAVLLE